MTTLNEISGVITSPFYPRHYSTNQSCSWEIRARKVKRIIFIIEDMDFSWWCSRVWYERQQKDFLKFISIFAYNIMVLFLVHSEPIGQYIHKTPPCISLENHIRFQTKMGKVYNRFQTKTAQKPYQFLSKGQ